jgi:hypothetical protein
MSLVNSEVYVAWLAVVHVASSVDILCKVFA